ncbi:hypothetical protein [Bifidobacterium canis]|uniref:Uncharacterized protein n=1 Tax=Bifidobacterium canis TaxID=2610880 RepID=A0A7K1J4D0_9BIFI|nr:hypothetical protein [Bifidobacterium canis]MUH59305.1 hypothetical protein [Bifidobacterium canis]
MTRAMGLVFGYVVIFAALGAAVFFTPLSAWWWAAWIIWGLWGCIAVYYERVYSRMSVIFYAFVWPVDWIITAAAVRNWSLFGLSQDTVNNICMVFWAVTGVVYLVYKMREKPESEVAHAPAK